MKRSLDRIALRMTLALSCALGACQVDTSAAPATVNAKVDEAQTEYDYLKDQISALEFLIEEGGGLDQLLTRGADADLIAKRRVQVASELPGLRRRLAAFATDKGRASQPAIGGGVQSVSQEEAPACLILLNADDCFADQYSTIDHRGSGTVYQHTLFIFHHNTSTYVSDNGSLIGMPLNTNNFGLAPTHSATYSFSPADPNCLSGIIGSRSRPVIESAWVSQKSVLLKGKLHHSTAATAITNI